MKFTLTLIALALLIALSNTLSLRKDHDFQFDEAGYQAKLFGDTNCQIFSQSELSPKDQTLSKPFLIKPNVLPSSFRSIHMAIHKIEEFEDAFNNPDNQDCPQNSNQMYFISQEVPYFYVDFRGKNRKSFLIETVNPSSLRVNKNEIRRSLIPKQFLVCYSQKLGAIGLAYIMQVGPPLAKTPQ